MKGKPVFGELHEREELLRRLNEVPGISLPISAASGRKQIRLSDLGDEGVQGFLAVMDWFAERWRRSP
jgi:hypothetical protein